MTVNVENVQKLIDYYAAKPGVLNWSYDQCVAGAMLHMGVTKGLDDHEGMCEFLGLPFKNTLVAGNRALYEMISGPGWAADRDFYTISPEDKKAVVLGMLESFQKTGNTVWRDPQKN
jgi:hypothetical protein